MGRQVGWRLALGQLVMRLREARSTSLGALGWRSDCPSRIWPSYQDIRAIPVGQTAVP